MTRHRRYNLWLLAWLAGFLAPILVLGGLQSFSDRSPDSIVASALGWQAETGGIVGVPGGLQEKFKLATLDERRAGVETVIFGASTVMGITERVLRSTGGMYNLAIDGNPTNHAIAEARYVIAGDDRIRLVYLALDWALGYPFRQVPVPPFTGPSPDDPAGGFLARMADALTLPRVRALFRILGTVARSDHPATAFASEFLPEGWSDLDPIRCSDGTAAAYFGHPDYPTSGCPGFRADGSATFGYLIPLDQGSAARIRAEALAKGSIYLGALSATAGVPNPAYLSALAQLAAVLAARGGRLIVILPPLVPGLEQALTEDSRTRGNLNRLKDDIARWSTANGIAVIDGGRSEQFGCDAAEFVDAHHALESCYMKVFAHLPPG